VTCAECGGACEIEPQYFIEGIPEESWKRLYPGKPHRPAREVTLTRAVYWSLQADVDFCSAAHSLAWTERHRDRLRELERAGRITVFDLVARAREEMQLIAK
jgi:hypothetical protein